MIDGTPHRLVHRRLHARRAEDAAGAERIPAVRCTTRSSTVSYEIPTLQEVIALASACAASRRAIGIYPETKHPTYSGSIGLSLEEPLVASLRRATGSTAGALPCSSSRSRSAICKELPQTRVPLVQLIEPTGSPMTSWPRATRDLRGPGHARRAARHRRYADGVGPEQEPHHPAHATTAALRRPSSLTRTRRLLVHPFTFRAENTFLPLELRSRHRCGVADG